VGAPERSIAERHGVGVVVMRVHSTNRPLLPSAPCLLLLVCVGACGGVPSPAPELTTASELRSGALEEIGRVEEDAVGRARSRVRAGDFAGAYVELCAGLRRLGGASVTLSRKRAEVAIMLDMQELAIFDLWRVERSHVWSADDSAKMGHCYHALRHFGKAEKYYAGAFSMGCSMPAFEGDRSKLIATVAGCRAVAKEAAGALAVWAALALDDCPVAAQLQGEMAASEARDWLAFFVPYWCGDYRAAQRVVDAGVPGCSRGSVDLARAMLALSREDWPSLRSWARSALHSGCHDPRAAARFVAMAYLAEADAAAFSEWSKKAAALTTAPDAEDR